MKRLVSHKKKVDCFVEHYAEVSWNNFTGDDGKTNIDAKNLLQISTTDRENCKEFSIKELKTALKKMRRKGTPFLIELEPEALTILLGIYNESFRTAACPQI